MGINVYEDLGYPDAESMFLKAGLMAHIQRAIRDQGIDLVSAAERAGIDADTFEEYLDGHFREVSEGDLLRFLNRLGHSVDIVVTPKGEGEAKVTVRGGREQAAA